MMPGKRLPITLVWLVNSGHLPIPRTQGQTRGLRPGQVWRPTG